MSDPADFTRLVPGFDFLQGLVKQANAALPGMGQWVAPTLDPQEIDKRIEELRTVQFWLEQNARMIGATIQALEVQRMTLATLQSMNVQMSDVASSLKASVSPPMTATAPRAPSPATPAPPAATAPPPADDAPPNHATGSPAARPVDPMRWWDAVTRQFSDIAAAAVRDLPASPLTAPAAGAAPASRAPGRKAAPKKPAAKTSASTRASATGRSRRTV